MRKDFQEKKGFTLFIAMIVSSLLLGIGFSIGNIILKQLQLTGSGRESQIAFYAADSGAECALYWDRKDGSQVTQVDGSFSASTTATIYCGSGDTALALPATKIISGSNATTTFYVDFSDPLGTGGNACAKVTVGKNGPYTTIDSRGYDVPLSGGVCDTSNPRTVERGLRVTF